MFSPKIAMALNEGNEFTSEAAYKLGGFVQDLTLTIFEAHHIHLSRRAWFIPDFYNVSAGLQGGQTFCLCSGPAPASSELKGPLRIRHFWDQSEDLQRILSEHKTTLIKRRAKLSPNLFS